MLRPGSNLVIPLALALLPACGVVRERNEVSLAGSKITFDLSRLNSDGLQGPPDGLRALHYEFCIPGDSTLADEVQQIDSTLEVFKGPRGRVQCSEDEFLCLGNTHQPGFRSVLLRLAELRYIRRIEESFFEN